MHRFGTNIAGTTTYDANNRNTGARGRHDSGAGRHQSSASSQGLPRRSTVQLEGCKNKIKGRGDRSNNTELKTTERRKAGAKYTGASISKTCTRTTNYRSAPKNRQHACKAKEGFRGQKSATRELHNNKTRTSLKTGRGT